LETQMMVMDLQHMNTIGHMECFLMKLALPLWMIVIFICFKESIMPRCPRWSR